jgi:hypothetical protein
VGTAPAVSGRSRGEAERQAACQRKEKAHRSQKDSFAIPKKSRDPSVNSNFSLIQNPNEKNVQSKVVENFKSYKNALGFEFKISKDTVLF